MKRRAAKLERLARVQTQLQRAAEWALHDLRRELDVLQQRERVILDALARDSALLLGLAPALTERLSELKAHSDRVQRACEDQVDLVMEQTRRRTLIEKMELDLAGKVERAAESARLEEISANRTGETLCPAATDPKGLSAKVTPLGCSQE